MELLIGAGAGCAALLLGGIVLITSTTRHITVLGLLAAAAGIYVLDLVALFITHSIWFSHGAITIGAIVLALGLVFAIQFARKTAWYEYLCLIPILSIGITAPTGWYIVGPQWDPVQQSLVPIPGPAAPLLVIGVLAHCLMMGYFLQKTIRNSQGEERVQAQVITTAFVLLIGTIVLGNVLAPQLGITTANMVTGLSLIAFIGSIGYVLRTTNITSIQIWHYRGVLHSIVPLTILGSLSIAFGALAILKATVPSLLSYSLIAIAVIGGALLGQVIQQGKKDRLRQWLLPQLHNADAIRTVSEHLLGQATTKEEMRRGIQMLLRTILRVEKITWHENVQSQGTVDGGIQLVVAGIGAVELHPREHELYTMLDHELIAVIQTQLTPLVQAMQIRRKEQVQQEQSERRLVADIAHGLQTPLAVIRIASEQVNDATQNDTIQRAITELTTRIQSLITFARAGIPIKETQTQPIAISQLLEETGEYIRTIATSKEVTVVSTIAPDQWITGRRDDIETLITNLLANALEYASRGDAPHTVFITALSNDNAFHLTIADTGPGIAEQDKTKIFEPRYRGTGAPHRGGMGLGLAIVAQVVKSHHGTIVLRDRVGGGTEIEVVLPVLRSGSQMLH